MLIFSGGQLRNHRLGLKFGHKWACKTIEFNQNNNTKASYVYEEQQYDMFWCIHTAICVLVLNYF